MRRIYSTSIGGRLKPEYRLFVGAVTVMTKKCCGRFTQWPSIEHPTFQLGGGHCTIELIFSVANAKTKTHLKLIFQIFHFAYKIQQNFTTVFRMVLKRLKLHQCFDGMARNFSAHKHVKLHHFVKHFCKKWCSITPSGNTVRQHQCGKQVRAR